MALSGTGLAAPPKNAIDTAVTLFRDAGHQLADPPILQPANVFIDLTGEDIRRRLYLTSGANGTDLCLRPDFTIPVCRAHLESGAARLPAAYFYHGPVFRQRAEGLGEIPQIGAESLGRADRDVADADMLALSVQALDAFGAQAAQIRTGDESLFVAVLDGLGLPAVWRRRLRDLFGEPEKLAKAIARMAGNTADDDRDIRLGFLSALDGADPADARAAVEDLLSIAGISAVGGRSAGEIAERFLEQAALAKGSSGSVAAAETLSAYLSITAPADQAGAAVATFAKQNGLDLSAPLAAYTARLSAMRDRGLDVGAITFDAGFGRRLDYYTGFIFEIYGPAGAKGGQLVGGGRYDRLLNLLGAKADIPAIGFSIWLDRVAAATGARA
ncbi:MAG: ATP phosphoribosyltransferase regulatory subunit [Roseibium sp.]|nr:ATP phosphoribosyltransferase regulatory subunit [Roseibium sp.]